MAGQTAAMLLAKDDHAVTVLDTHDGIGVIDVGADSDGRSVSPETRHDGRSRRAVRADLRARRARL
jgi:23S rRNA A2030 N6-methylase RlmJ